MPDGSRTASAEVVAPVASDAEALALGRRLADALALQGAREIIAALATQSGGESAV